MRQAHCTSTSTTRSLPPGCGRTCLVAPRGPANRLVQQRWQDVDVPSLDVPALLRRDEDDCSALLAAVLTESQKGIFQELPDARASSPIFRVLQPRELDQLLVYPALRKLERFDPVLDAFLLKEEEREQERMDQLENQILAGAPVSAADRAAWRRWATRRKRMKRRNKLPKASSSQSSWGGRRKVSSRSPHVECADLLDSSDVARKEADVLDCLSVFQLCHWLVAALVLVWLLFDLADA